MALLSVRCWTAAALVALANPASSAVVGYDAQGAFLGVTEDTYLGGKFGGKYTMPAPGGPPLLTMPSTAGIPAVDPMILFAVAMVVVLLLLANQDGDDSRISDTIAPPPGTPSSPDLPLGPVTPGNPPAQTRPPVFPTQVPLPSGLVLILAGLGGLALMRARRD